MIRRRLLIAGLVFATLLLAALGTAIAVVRSIRSVVAPAVA
jgi:hypothetical protein